MSDTRTLGGHIRTFLIVTLITVMVWLLAESKLVRTQTIDAQVVLTTVSVAGDTQEDASLVVRQATGQAVAGQVEQDLIRTVTIEIEGSTSGIDRFIRRLQNRFELRVGREIPAQPGVHLLDFQAILRDSADLAIHGVVITQVTPESVLVEVDELVTREFPVGFDMPIGVELDGAPRAEPPSVRVVAPSSVLSRVRATEAVVHVEPAMVSSLAKGRRETIPDAAIQIDGLDQDAWATQIEPGHVDVFVTLHTLTETVNIDRLPVQVLIAPAEIGKWTVLIADADRDLVNIVVSGPAEAVEQLRAGIVKPRAFIALGFEELERGIESKLAQILGLPAGCKVENPEILVGLEIKRMDSAPSGSPDGPAGEPIDD